MLYKYCVLVTKRNIDRLQILPPIMDGCRRVTRGGPSTDLPSILPWRRVTAILSLFDPLPPPAIVGKARYSPCPGGVYFPHAQSGIVSVRPHRSHVVAHPTLPNLHPNHRYYLDRLRLSTSHVARLCAPEWPHARSGIVWVGHRPLGACKREPHRSNVVAHLPIPTSTLF